MTPPDTRAKPRNCKGCQKPVYLQPDSTWKHDQRATVGAPPSGVKERRVPIVTPPADPDPAPRRFHFLNRPLFGGKGQGS